MIPKNDYSYRNFFWYPFSEERPIVEDEEALPEAALPLPPGYPLPELHFIPNEEASSPITVTQQPLKEE